MSDKVSDERLREYAASFNNPDVRALAAELLALRAQQQAAGWRVKPLEWDADGFALTPFGAYTVTDAEGGADGYQWTFHCYPYGTADEVVHPSIGAAKAAAQSDYAARINSAIEPASATACDATSVPSFSSAERNDVTALGTTRAEAICRGRAMDQWNASLKRPDLAEYDRVRGAIEACIRQAFALRLIPAASASDASPISASGRDGE